MTEKNEILWNRAVAAIDGLYKDTSVELYETLSNLEALMDEIEDRLNALEETISLEES